jgi:hypothetical protein
VEAQRKSNNVVVPSEAKRLTGPTQITRPSHRSTIYRPPVLWVHFGCRLPLHSGNGNEWLRHLWLLQAGMPSGPGDHKVWTYGKQRFQINRYRDELDLASVKAVRKILNSSVRETIEAFRQGRTVRPRDYSAKE